jgi:hypothetical protein
MSSSATHPATPASLLEAVSLALRRAADHNSGETAAPVAVLWPDKERQWDALAARLQSERPGFWTLGDFNAARGIGPAIWLKCMIARTLEPKLPDSIIPIIYLPGVSRQELRTVEDCPRELQPLVELQFRGVIWSHPNSKDWTIAAFLQAKEGGLGLDVASGAGVADAARRALSRFMVLPLQQLRGRRLDVSFFNDQLSADPERDLLIWMNNPDSFVAQLSKAELDAFRTVCKQKFKFDPDKDGVVVAGEHLGQKQSLWAKVWTRFAESPEAYPGIPGVLRKSKPKILTIDDAWPQDNESRESDLRAALLKLANMAPAHAVAEIAKLELEHKERRDWVWARLKQSPLVQALKYLALVAEESRTPLVDKDVGAVAKAYITHGYIADAAAIEALAEVESPKDVDAVVAALKAVYKPWLEQAALHFQELVKKTPAPISPPASSIESVQSGTCEFFADGLRYDIGVRLKEELTAFGFAVEMTTRWSALPSVTPTAKPAVSPITNLIVGTDGGDDFMPAWRDSGKALNAEKFRKTLSEHGFQVLNTSATGNVDGRAWTEFGELDHHGHSDQLKLARYARATVRELALRIRELLQAGWKRVHIVTDHGWLLVPGGLPKVELPGHLAETRWGRCALLKSTTSSELQTIPWHWNKNIRFAVPPGIGSFKGGQDYNHGGLSIQECLIPDMVVSLAGDIAATKAAVESVEWVKCRCRVSTSGAPIGAQIDIRTKVNDAASSLLPDKAPKALKADGGCNPVVEDDTMLGSAVFVVLLDESGKVIVKANTTVGGE